MTKTRKQPHGGPPRRLAVMPLAFSLAALAASPGDAAPALPAGAEAGLRQAAQHDAAAFRAALRQAIAAAPGSKDAILQHALQAHPRRSAELLLAGLYDPALDPSLDPSLAGAAPGRLNVALTATPPESPRQEAPQQEAETTSDATDKAEGIEESGLWNGTIVLGATVRTGNTDNAGVTGESTIAYTGRRWRHRWRASADYLRNRAQTQEQAFEGEYEAQYEFDPRTFTYGLARYEEDRFSGFDYEFTASLGLGRNLVQEPGHEWIVTLGPSLRLAQRSASGERDQLLGGRFTNLLSWELSDTTQIENRTEALADQERVRVNNDVTLKVRIVEQLSGQFSFGFEYRSDTPPEGERTDTTTRAAIVYDF